MTGLPSYRLERIFDAPREFVWRAWTDPQLLPRWYGPRVETIVHRLDLEPRGLWLVEMKWDGKSHHQRVEYLEVSPPTRLVWLHSNADSDWKIAPSAMMPDWPRVLLTTVTFDERAGRTGVHLTWTPHEATSTEIACFSAAVGRMGKGWEAGMDLLADLLGEMQATKSSAVRRPEGARR